MLQPRNSRGPCLLYRSLDAGGSNPRRGRRESPQSRNLRRDGPLHSEGPPGALPLVSACVGGGPILHPWLEAGSPPQVCAVVHLSTCHYQFHISGIPDVGQRIAVDDDQVGAFASFDGSSFLVESHHVCRNGGRCLDRFHGSETRSYVELDLAMQAVAGNRLIG